jgi:uncharacterized Zn finger protein (UPF0148 family)
MNEDPTQVIDESGILEGDILFNCPLCGKSMAIEAAGAGLMVPCANCGKPVQVPIPDPRVAEASAAVPRPDVDAEENPEELIRQLDSALALANAQIDELIAGKEALQERRAYLEQLRMANASRLERIAEELSTVQDALDRAMVLLAEARAEKPA